MWEVDSMRHRWSFARICACTVIGLALILVGNAFAASKVRVLHTFQGGKDGASPWATLLLDNKGNLYGTTEYGGNQGCHHEEYGIGCGTVFSLKRSRNSWKETVLYRFQGGSDGSHPRANLIFGQDGNLYSTTSTGGNGSVGTAFRLVPGDWMENVIFNFSYRGGEYPQCALTFDKQGNLYGVAPDGGPHYTGTIFELVPNPKGEWTEKVIHGFKDVVPDGGLAYAGLIMDQAGHLYGTTDGGGVTGDGSVYELSASESGWKERLLYSFPPGPTGLGVLIYDGVIFDRKGNLYGTAGNGGIGCFPYGCGSVIQLKRAGGKWQETTIHQFTSESDGWGPNALIFDNAGNLYSTTYAGGQYGFGTVFKLSPVKGGWQKTTLYSFPGGAQGAYPLGALMLDQQGNFFGITHAGGGGRGAHCKRDGCGVVFEITP
jgi:uncharacterized repeat protein (TIGR03803 family)